MGVIDGIKGVGSSIGTITKLCNKSWLQLDASEDRTTYVFKMNNELHLTINGLTQIVPWKFFPENERLVIYFFNKGGASFNIRFIENDFLLVLTPEATNDMIILTNESNKNAPKTVDEAISLFFNKKQPVPPAQKPLAAIPKPAPKPAKHSKSWTDIWFDIKWGVENFFDDLFEGWTLYILFALCLALIGWGICSLLGVGD